MPRKVLSPESPSAERLPAILKTLARLYPETKTALDYHTPLQLAIATILSAQCTDRRVNLVTPPLFARYQSTADFANADLGELEGYVRSTGFFRMKAKNIRAMAQLLLERHGGEVPGDQAALVALPGIGRKTANVILGDAFGIPGITVDTHVGRLSRRLALTTHTNPVKVERDLMALVPEREWTRFSHRLIFHGRQICFARKPRCSDCVLASICPKIGVPTPKTLPREP